jgi:site-specific DNA recombinase
MTFLYLIGAFSEMDRENIISNCKMGMKERALNGLWNGGRIIVINLIHKNNWI